MLMLAEFGLSVIVAISGKSIAKGDQRVLRHGALHRRPRPTYSVKRFTFGVKPLLSGSSSSRR